MVFDAPNKGCPSRHLAPLSRGRENRLPKIFFATTGVPFATIIRNSSRVITQSCIPSCYLKALQNVPVSRYKVALSLVVRRRLPSGYRIIPSAEARFSYRVGFCPAMESQLADFRNEIDCLSAHPDSALYCPASDLTRVRRESMLLSGWLPSRDPAGHRLARLQLPGIFW
jgi:hypothetical protein